MRNHREQYDYPNRYDDDDDDDDDDDEDDDDGFASVDPHPMIVSHLLIREMSVLICQP